MKVWKTRCTHMELSKNSFCHTKRLFHGTSMSTLCVWSQYSYTNAHVIGSKYGWLQHPQKNSRKWPTYAGQPLHTTPLPSIPTISGFCVSGEELKFQESQMYKISALAWHTYYLLFSFPDHYLGLNGLSMREAGDSTYTPSSSQPLNPNMPYSPDGMIDTSHENLRNFSFFFF